MSPHPRHVLALAAIIVLVSCGTATATRPHPDSTFRAAAAQLSFVGGWNLTAAQNQMAAVKAVVPVIAKASSEGADIVNFPEDMFYWGATNRSNALPFCETIPAVDTGVTVNPCSDASYNTSTHLVLKSMSCAAQKYGIHVVVNTAEVEWCTPGAVSKDGQTCPSDGHFMFNTDVVFDNTGTVIAKYRKAHLTQGSEVTTFNEPPVKAVTFDTSFAGRMGLMTCYDIEFVNPAQALVDAGATTIMYEVDWVTSPPILSGLMVQQARSRELGINFIASNNNGLADVASGGIYSAGQPIATWFAPYTEGQDKLLVADVPVLTKPVPPPPPPARRQRSTHRAARAVPSPALGHTTCSVGPLPAPCYGFTATPGTSGAATVLDGTFNCTAEWEVSEASPTDAPRAYAVMAVATQFTFGVPDPLFIQVCALFQCIDFPACTPLWNSTAVFSRASLETNVTSQLPLPMLGFDDGTYDVRRAARAYCRRVTRCLCCCIGLGCTAAQVAATSALDVEYTPHSQMRLTMPAATKPLYSLSVFGFSTNSTQTRQQLQ